MIGASFAHDLITANLTRSLGDRLRGGPCVALANGMRTRIEATDPVATRTPWSCAVR